MQDLAFFVFDHAALGAGCDQHFQFLHRVDQFMTGGRFNAHQLEQGIPGPIEGPDGGFKNKLCPEGGTGNNQGGALGVLKGDRFWG